MTSNCGSSILLSASRASKQFVKIRGIQAAKKLGKRALGAIEFTDNHSHMNIWKVLLNLEFYFGSEAGTKETYRDALGGGCNHIQLSQHMMDL